MATTPSLAVTHRAYVEALDAAISATLVEIVARTDDAEIRELAQHLLELEEIRREVIPVQRSCG